MNLNGVKMSVGPVVAGMVLAGTGLLAAEAVKFEPTLQAGKRYTVVMEQKGTSKMAMGDVQMEQKVDLTMGNVLEAKKGEGEDVGLMMKSGRIKVSTEVFGQKMEFDSENPAGANPMVAGMMKALADSSVEATLKPDGSLADVKLNKAASSSAASPMGDMGMGPEMLEAMLKGYLGEGTPDEAVEPGAEWEHSMEVPMPQMKGRKVATKYKFEGMEALEGTEKKLAKVSFSGTLAGEAEGDGSVSAAGVTIKMDIKDMKTEGVMYYDPEKRFFTRTESTSTMNLSIDNGETTMEIPSTQKQVTVLEKLEDL